MKNIYIIDEYITSQRNGIGKFTSEIIKIFKEIPDLDISIVKFNSPEKEFNIKATDGISRINFPYCGGNYFEENSKVVTGILSLYFKDSGDNIFLINHSPCDKLIETLKQYYPLSAIVFVIHDLSWTEPLLGNLELFKYIIENKEKKAIQKNINNYF